WKAARARYRPEAGARGARLAVLRARRGRSSDAGVLGPRRLRRGDAGGGGRARRPPQGARLRPDPSLRSLGRVERDGKEEREASPPEVDRRRGGSRSTVLDGDGAGRLRERGEDNGLSAFLIEIEGCLAPLFADP